jgi:2-C-methyl-D-erythritol 2,4-cyclodiphosphate synthase
LLNERNARVINVDATVIAEAPKIALHAPAMRQNIASAIGLSESAVSVKATTNEKLGPIGQGEGIAAIAIATIETVGRDRLAPRKTNERSGGPSLPS